MNQKSASRVELQAYVKIVTQNLIKHDWNTSSQWYPLECLYYQHVPVSFSPSHYSWVKLILHLGWYALKQKFHFDDICITDYNESCQNDNILYTQWWKFRQNDDIAVSEYYSVLECFHSIAYLELVLQHVPSVAKLDILLDMRVTQRADLLLRKVKC